MDITADDFSFVFCTDRRCISEGVAELLNGIFEIVDGRLEIVVQLFLFCDVRKIELTQSVVHEGAFQVEISIAFS